MLVCPLLGFLLKHLQCGFITIATKGLLNTIFAANLGDDLNGYCSAAILFTSDKHTTKVVICLGTPKSDTQSASHVSVGHIID